MIAEGSAAVTSIIVSTVHPGPGGSAIFTGKDGYGKWVRAVAVRDCMPRAPQTGEAWLLTGCYLRHEVYGVQLHVEQASICKPTGNLLLLFLTAHPIFRGIGFGRVKALRLSREFGERLPALLDAADVGTLAAVINEQTARNLIAAWQLVGEEAAVVTFMDRHGVNCKLASKVIRFWPGQAVEKLEENPYRLLHLTDWLEVDRLAASLGIAADDPRRQIAAAEAVLYYRLDSLKDTLTCHETLAKGIAKLLRSPINMNLAEMAIGLALSDGAITGSEDAGYQPTGCALMERFIASRFRQMLNQEESVQLPLFNVKAVTPVVERCVDQFERQVGVTLNAEQRSAVHMAATETVSILTGGAGVGKTTVLSVIHQVVESLGGTVVQMALAGRAAHRMREATGREAYTICGFLNKVKLGNIRLDSRPLIIIDESSMLDLPLLYRVMRALPRGSRLVLVGDPNQLPPIGFGLTFHVAARSDAIPSKHLTQIHRQAASTGIPQVAAHVRDGVVPYIPTFSGRGKGVSFYECQSKLIVSSLVDIVQALGGVDETQILGVTKNGEAGVKQINLVFHNIQSVSERRLAGWELAETDPVMFTVNDYERELYNGSLGRVVEVCTEPRSSKREEGTQPARLVCDFEGRLVELSDDDLGNLELAYAITTHKAQGSQFKRIAVVVTESRLLDRTLIYTAVTRGVEQVVFVGNRDALRTAITNPPKASRRNVGFKIESSKRAL